MNRMENEEIRDSRKLKALLVEKILKEQTDEKHVLNAEEIVAELEESYEVFSQEKSVRRDLHLLQDFYELVDEDYEIEYKTTDNERGWRMISRPFEFEEVQLLIECINSSKSISNKTAERLIHKVSSLRSNYEKDALLKPDIYTVGRNRTDNNNLIYLLAFINEAINKMCQITFAYNTYIIQNGKVVKVNKKNGELRTVSPYKLMMNDGNYYLIAYNGEFDNIICYRVDRIENITLTDKKREGEEKFRGFRVEDFIKQSFNMWDGERRYVKIRFTINNLTTIVDRFDKKDIREVDEKHFVLNTQVLVSRQFFAWLTSFGNQAKLLEPEDVKEQFKKFVQKVII